MVEYSPNPGWGVTTFCPEVSRVRKANSIDPTIRVNASLSLRDN